MYPDTEQLPDGFGFRLLQEFDALREISPLGLGLGLALLLLVAWVLAWAGPAPAIAAATSGSPVPLPAADARRDGSGTPSSQPIAAIGSAAAG